MSVCPVDKEISPYPHNIELEQALLGAILLNNDAWRNVGHVLEPGDFYNELHARIYAAFAEQIKAGRVSPLTLKPLFENENVADDLTVPQYLGRLVATATTVINAPDYARNLKEMSVRRELIADGELFVTLIADMNCDMPGVCSEHISSLDDVLASRTRISRQSVGDAAFAAADRLDEQQEIQFAPTGLGCLNTILGGYYRGEYVIVAARPGMGKSCFMSSTLMRLGLKGYGVHYFSLEMTREALAQRCLSDLVWNAHTPIPYIEMRRAGVEEHDRQRLKEAAKRLAGASMIAEDAPGLTVPELAARAKAQAQRFERIGKRLDILCIDHIGKIMPSGKYKGSKVNEVGEISGALANLAKELDCTVIALSQLNRGVESQERKNKRPVLSDIRASGDIEQDADVVIFLYRAAYYLERMKFDDQEKETKRLQDIESCKNLMEIIVAKQRSGPRDMVRAYVDMASNVVRDLKV